MRVEISENVKYDDDRDRDGDCNEDNGDGYDDDGGADKNEALDIFLSFSGSPAPCANCP